MKKYLLLLSFILLAGLPTLLQAQQDAVMPPIKQYYNATAHKHIYTTNPNELGAGKDGYVFQKNIGRLNYQYNPSSGEVIYRFFNSSSGGHYLTTHVNIFPKGYHLEGPQGCSKIIPLQNPTVPIYEYYSSAYDDFYYSDQQVSPGSGYVLNGVAFTAYTL
ncbi:hypothetical protein [Mucilaginibacter rubeus]|uniref:DUF5648 domain-containing protein n=1 Tax=Mucilaginibacter rubeus TaxID=2027860 RepID=A0A5C1I2W8_9SPHI|nr:hypothetical protein [Mucilaginibacter rubeus]QEM12557.1 hypothetical protein DEO27_021930 [Mucilaginibacter rubeus]